jgi:hypothetical protein
VNFAALKTEVFAQGFDATQFGTRAGNYLNDFYQLVCRRVAFYGDEATQTYQTVSGTATYSLPTNWARIRSLLDTDREQELQQVGLRDIDRANVAAGVANFYALDGQSLHLYPTPNQVSNLTLRYWLLPSPMVADTDTPIIPVDWHHLLIEGAVARCYWAEDDSAMGQAWDQKAATTLAEFMADARFPSTDYPTQVKSFWGDDGTIGSRGWSPWPYGAL